MSSTFFMAKVYQAKKSDYRKILPSRVVNDRGALSAAHSAL